QGRLVLLLVVEPHDDLFGVLDDVIVGEDVALGVDDEARAETALRLLALLRPGTEEPLEGLGEVARLAVAERPLRTLLPGAAEAVRSAVVVGRLLALRASRDVDDDRTETLRERREVRHHRDRTGGGRDHRASSQPW